jgi:hypothetical protein
MEVMEIRQAIDQVADGSDTELAPLLQENAERIQVTSRQLEEAWDAIDNNNNNDKNNDNLARARKLTAHLQYWHRVAVTIRDKMEH